MYVKALASPVLDAEEVEDGEAGGGAGPGGVSAFDPLEADQARDGAGGGGGEERLDLGEVEGGGR